MGMHTNAWCLQVSRGKVFYSNAWQRRSACYTNDLQLDNNTRRKVEQRFVFIPARPSHSLLLAINCITGKQQLLEREEAEGRRGLKAPPRCEQPFRNWFHLLLYSNRQQHLSARLAERLNENPRSHRKTLWYAKMMTAPFCLSGGATFPIRLCWFCFTWFDSICKGPLRNQTACRVCVPW